jgi:nicotinate-nucleotide pyrophosphorylase (carboxylating)
MELPADALHECVRRALAEDLGTNTLAPDADVTCRLAVPRERRATARIVAKARGCLAGTDVAVAVFRELDPVCDVSLHRRDGDRVAFGDKVLDVAGAAWAVLSAERTALNFLQRLSGVATATQALVDAVAGTGTVILDTRKTTPGLRMLEKQAVLAGGGQNHRQGLFDQVLLKENHFALAQPVPYEEVVRRCVEGQDLAVVAEARTQAEAVSAVRGGAAIVLLDNFSPGPLLRSAVAAVRAAALEVGRRVAIEASGGVTLANARQFAECGVDRLSAGSITHSAPALDMSLKVEGA